MGRKEHSLSFLKVSKPDRVGHFGERGHETFFGKYKCRVGENRRSKRKWAKGPEQGLHERNPKKEMTN